MLPVRTLSSPCRSIICLVFALPLLASLIQQER
jgi:hypothetical protein